MQQNAIVLWFILTLLQVAALLLCLRLPATDRAEIDTLFTFPLWLHVIFVPLVAGASAVAEEEKIGARGWHLTFPASRSAQWCVKLLVVSTFTTLFAVGVVRFWCWVGVCLWPWSQEFGGYSFLTCSMNGSSFVPLTISQFVGLFVALYASSRAPDSFRAFLVASGIAAAIAICLNWANPFYTGVNLFELMMGQRDPSFHIDIIGQVFLGIASLFGIITVRKVACASAILAALLILLILVSSFRSYRILDCSTRHSWTAAVKMFVPALMALWLVFALFGGIEEWKLWEEAQPRIQQMTKDALEKAGHKP